MKLSIILAILGTSISFLFGQWHISLTILLMFMSADTITGLLKGAYLGKLRSAVGYKGMLKKGGMMLVVILAHFLDLLTASGMPVFRTMATYFYIGLEGLSITENLGLMGVPLPNGIKRYIQQLNQQEVSTPEAINNAQNDMKN